MYRACPATMFCAVKLGVKGSVCKLGSAPDTRNVLLLKL
jgi:hypothetical protein